MAPKENAPAEDELSGSDTEQAAWLLSRAELLRSSGELAEAAALYRQASRLLVEAGEDERSIAVSKLASEMAALDHAGRPPSAPEALGVRVSGVTERDGAAPRNPLRPDQDPGGEAITQNPPRPGGSSLSALVDSALGELAEHEHSMPLTPSFGTIRPAKLMSYSPTRAQESLRIRQILPALNLFKDLPPGVQDTVARETRLVRYANEDAICEAGAPEGPMFVVVRGRAAVNVSGETTAAIELAPGDHVGEVAAMYGGPRTATVYAHGLVEALCFAPSLVRALARDHECFRVVLMESVRERVHAVLPRLAPLLRRLSAPERKTLFQAFELAHLDEGARVLAEGERAPNVVLVAGGEIDLYGGELLPGRTHRARAGEFLGVASALTGEPSGITGRAARQAFIARMSREHFRELAGKLTGLRAVLEDVGAPGSGVVC